MYDDVRCTIALIKMKGNVCIQKSVKLEVTFALKKSSLKKNMKFPFDCSSSRRKEVVFLKKKRVKQNCKH